MEVQPRGPEQWISKATPFEGVEGLTLTRVCARFCLNFSSRLRKHQRKYLPALQMLRRNTKQNDAAGLEVWCVAQRFYAINFLSSLEILTKSRDSSREFG
jgi:hypothetical protein